MTEAVNAPAPGGTMFNLRGKMSLLLLAVGILPATLIFTAFLWHRADFENMRMQRLTDMAVAINDVIDRNLFERYGDVQAFGLNAAAHDPANWKRPDADNPLVHAMDGYMTGYGIYKLMLMLSPSGDVLAVNSVDGLGQPLDTAGLYGRNFADRAWFNDALKGKFLDGEGGLTGTAVEQPSREPLIADIYNADGYVIPFSAPVRDSSGAVIGVWVNFADFGLVEDIIAANYQTIAAAGMTSAEITLLDPQGRVIVDWDPHGQGWQEYSRNFDVIGKLDLNALGVSSAVKAVQGAAGFEISHHARKQLDQATGYAHNLGAYGYPGLDWSVLVRVPVQDAFPYVEQVNRVMLVVAGLALLGLGVIAWITGGAAARPITRLTRVMQALAGGDHKQNIPATDRRDEIGDMARTVEVFKENAIERRQLETQQALAREAAEEQKRAALTGMAHTVEEESRTAVDSVARATGEMDSAAGEMLRSADAVSSSAEIVAQASEEALTASETVSSATDQLAASIREINQQVTQSANVTRKAVDISQRTQRSIRQLSDTVQKIDEFAGIIGDIAEQTNLLALNATIESARAGEAGKGFAVVANEVKDLAGQTSRSTEEINRQLMEVRAATQTAVDSVGEIGGTIGEIDHIASSISAAMEEQGAATEEIARNVAETAAATRDMSARMGDVSREAEAARSKAVEMQETCSTVDNGVRELGRRMIDVVQMSVEEASQDHMEVKPAANVLKSPFGSTVTAPPMAQAAD